ASIAGLARRAAFAPPALLVVGGVVGLRRAPGWFERRPLRGRTILVTRPREQAGAFTDLLEEEGARVIELPAIEIRPPRSWAPLDRALARLEKYHLLIFTSANGVARFFERLSARRIDLRALHGIDLVAIGPATAAALTGRGLRVAAVPEEFRAEGIVRVLQRRALLGTRVLIPRAEAARDLLVRELRRRGARVEVAPVYRTVPSREGVEEARRMLRQGGIDLVTFASSSSVTHFLGKFRESGDRRRVRRLPAAAIGPITARTARRAGFRVVVMPKRFTITALAAAIVKKLRNSPSGTPRGS
ncbi:MAG TPA: uroporphyrinogen-III synthase, partial [Candidatus Polarisedimenticolia bacterium]